MQRYEVKEVSAQGTSNKAGFQIIHIRINWDPPVVILRCGLECVLCVLVLQPLYLSANKLTSYVSVDQLTPEFGGSLQYRHDIWLQNRIVSSVALWFDSVLIHSPRTLSSLLGP